mmetsp:Transcript_20345/g.32972  ORF Transcript_20345/g.32972 Transcript_20345/m.32972 type:complete len:162 (+) Transcript_20345:71-556(+)
MLRLFARRASLALFRQPRGSPHPAAAAAGQRPRAAGYCDAVAGTAEEGAADAGAETEAEDAGAETAAEEENKRVEEEKKQARAAVRAAAQVTATAQVATFLASLDIEPGKYQEKIKDLRALLYDVKTENLKKQGMPVKQRKKLLAHVEKYKQGLWAPKEMR